MITKVYKNRRGVPVGAFVSHHDYEEGDEDEMSDMIRKYFFTHDVRWAEEGAAGVHEDWDGFFYTMWIETPHGKWIIEKPSGSIAYFDLSAFDDVLASVGFEKDEDSTFNSTGYVRYTLYRTIHKFPTKADIKSEMNPARKQWLIERYEKKTKEDFYDWLEHNPDQRNKYYQFMIDTAIDPIDKEYYILERDRKIDRNKDFIEWMKEAHPDEYKRLKEIEDRLPW